MSFLRSAGRVAGGVVGIATMLAGGLWVKSLFDQSERQRAGVTVHVDNFSDRDVTVRVDGADWVVAEKGTSRTLTTLAEGPHRVEVVAGGAVLDAHQVWVENGRQYVLNALGGQVYTSREVSYAVGGSTGFSPRDDRRLTARWFEADDDYVFTEPPGSIRLPSGTTAVTRRWLMRGEPADAAYGRSDLPTTSTGLGR